MNHPVIRERTAFLARFAQKTSPTFVNRNRSKHAVLSQRAAIWRVTLTNVDYGPRPTNVRVYVYMSK